MYKTLRRWIAGLLGRARELFIIVAKGVGEDILSLLNDPDLQALAVAACREAAARGLSGDAAWRTAFEAFTASLRQRSITLATNIAETLLQTAYTVWRANGKPLS